MEGKKLSSFINEENDTKKCFSLSDEHLQSILEWLISTGLSKELVEHPKFNYVFGGTIRSEIGSYDLNEVTLKCVNGSIEFDFKSDVVVPEEKKSEHYSSHNDIGKKFIALESMWDKSYLTTRSSFRSFNENDKFNFNSSMLEVWDEKEIHAKADIMYINPNLLSIDALNIDLYSCLMGRSSKLVSVDAINTLMSNKQTGRLMSTCTNRDAYAGIVTTTTYSEGVERGVFDGLEPYKQNYEAYSCILSQNNELLVPCPDNFCRIDLINGWITYPVIGGKMVSIEEACKYYSEEYKKSCNMNLEMPSKDFSQQR